MAQPISNVLQGPSQSGLMGLTPKPKISSIGAPIASAISGIGNFLANPMQHTTQGNPTATSTQPINFNALNLQKNNPAVQPVKPVAPLPQATPQYNAGPAPVPPAVTGGQTNSFNDGMSGAQNLPAQTPAPTPTPPPAKGLFPSVASSLATGVPATNAALTQRAQDISDRYKPLFAAVRPQENSIAGEVTTGTAPVGEGNAAAVERADTAYINNLTQSQASEMQGVNTGLTASAQTQGALGTAGSLTSPQLGGIGQVPFSPDTLNQGNILGTTQPGGIAAAGNILGQLQGATAAGAAPGQAAAANTTTSGTAATNSYAGIYNTANTNAANYSQQQSAINAVGSQALNLLAPLTSSVNPSSSQFINARLNQLNTQFSSPQYAAFNTAIQSLQARITQALNAGEIPTTATSNAQAIANGNITVGALASTLQQVDAEMSAFVKTQTDLANSAKSQMTGGQGTSTSGQTSGTQGPITWDNLPLN